MMKYIYSQLKIPDKTFSIRDRLELCEMIIDELLTKHGDMWGEYWTKDLINYKDVSWGDQVFEVKK